MYRAILSIFALYTLKRKPAHSCEARVTYINSIQKSIKKSMLLWKIQKWLIFDSFSSFSVQILM
jgi:hypothetical protein